MPSVGLGQGRGKGISRPCLVDLPHRYIPLSRAGASRKPEEVRRYGRAGFAHDNSAPLSAAAWLIGMTTAPSDKPFKVGEHRAERRAVRATIKHSLDGDDRALYSKVYSITAISRSRLGPDDRL